MPPKKSKKGKKSKKSKKGNSKQKVILTPGEEILLYQIQIKEDNLNNFKLELEKVKEENEKNLQRLNAFRRDKEEFGNEMIKKYHELGLLTTNKVMYQKDDVINCMKSNWVIAKVEKQDIMDIHRNIEMKDKEIRDLENRISFLNYIRNTENVDNCQQIKILNQILDDMDNNFSTIKSYLEKQYFVKNAEIIEHEKMSTENFQRNACLKASKVIKNDMKQEFADHKWLVDKLNVHKENFEKLKTDIESLEAGNVKLNEKIFQLKQSETKFTNLFLTNIEPEEILFNEGILEYNINQVFNTHKSDSNSPLDFNSNKLRERIPSKGIEINADSSYSSWKDYLNLNPVNFDFLFVRGNLLNIGEARPKTDEEIQEEQFTVKSLPVNLQSLNEDLIKNIKDI